MSRRNALSVRHESFRVDADQLLAAIEHILGATAGPVASSSDQVQAHHGPSGVTDKGAPQGRISFPSSGQSVSRAFTVEGTLADIPTENHIWIAVEIDGLLWPKEPEIPSQDYQWSRQIVEGGDPPNGRFSLTLLMVDANGNQMIEEWMKNGRSTGGWPGLGYMSGARLHTVRNLNLTRE